MPHFYPATSTIYISFRGLFQPPNAVFPSPGSLPPDGGRSASFWWLTAPGKVPTMKAVFATLLRLAFEGGSFQESDQLDDRVGEDDGPYKR